MLEVSDHVDDIVEQWGRERPDLDVSALALVGRLLRASRLADARLSEGIRIHGLESGWFDLLAALRRSGPPFELNPSELMRTTLLSSGGMTKRIDRLADEGLVVRRPDPGDRRGTLIRLTARGKALIDRALETHLANEERLLGGLSSSQRRQLDSLLQRLLANLERRNS